MGNLPVPAATFFDDFAFDVMEYHVFHDNSLAATYRGLANSDENGNYIGFLMNEEPKISVGNILKTSDGFESFKVNQISYDRYNGKPELFKAYY